MRVLRQLLARVLVAIATLLGVSVLIFGAMRLLPGGFEEVVLGPISSPEMRAQVAREFGLDQSGVQQYFGWLGSALRGHLGISMATKQPVAAEMLRRAPATIELAVFSTAVALLVGIPLGLLAGLGAGPWRSFGRLVGSFGASVPEVVLGTVLVFVFSAWELGLTVGGYVPLSENVGVNLRAMALPALSLSVFGIALILRTTRDSVQRVLTEGHIVTAIAQGRTRWEIVRHHVLRNASIPVLTVSSTFISYLLGGAVIAEILFSVPGVGLYTYNALGTRDYAVVQAGVLLAATVFVVISTLADSAYVLLDPRIGAERTE
jgi:peptide/nickel transport system permease protein